MLNLIEKLFQTRNLYSILNNITAKDAADPKKLRVAYLRAALSYHPDKASPNDKEESTQKFQVLTKIYEVLKDDDNRKAFEKTGKWPDEDSKDLDFQLFTRLDENTILDFKKQYQGSDAEIDDLKQLYREHEGNIFKIIENLFFANILTDFDRFDEVIAVLVDKGELDEIPRGKSFATEKKRRITKAKKEAAEAEELLNEIRAKRQSKTKVKVDTEEDLRSVIMSRRETEGKSFLDKLEAKYSALEKGPKPKKPRRK